MQVGGGLVCLFVLKWGLFVKVAVSSALASVTPHVLIGWSLHVPVDTGLVCDCSQRLSRGSTSFFSLGPGGSVLSSDNFDHLQSALITTTIAMAAPTVPQVEEAGLEDSLIVVVDARTRRRRGSRYLHEDQPTPCVVGSSQV